VAGCDNGDEIAPPESSASPSAATAASSASADEPSPDEVLVDDVLAALSAAIGVLTQARRTAAVRGQVTPLLRAHRRHVEVLEGEPADQPPPGRLPSATEALRRVRRSEHELQGTLVDAATRAESGALARLLASMSASATQHLAVLPGEAAS
jgi:hypothetical protein